MATNDDSVLTSIKKVLGIDSTYSVFDVDILMHINTAFATLAQLGVGPKTGVEVHSASTKWSDLIGSDLELSGVKSYVALRVRLLFDPPATSFAIEAIKDQIREFEWRLNVAAETN